jgi:hypothetical protein
VFRELNKESRDIGDAHLQALKNLDLSSYPSIYSEDLESIMKVCCNGCFLDISNCRYISFETASKLAVQYPKLVMKVDQGFFKNKQRLKKDIHFMRSLYKLTWADELFNARTLTHFSSLSKLYLNNCEANFAPNTNHITLLPHICFLKMASVSFTKPLSLFTLLKATTSLELLVIRDCSGITEHDLEPLAHNTLLHKLVLRGCSMNKTTWEKLPLNSIKKLGVYNLPDFEDADQVVCRAISAAPRLKSLILGVPLVNDEFLETLSGFKSSLTHITKLFLGGISLITNNNNSTHITLIKYVFFINGDHYALNR